MKPLPKNIKKLVPSQTMIEGLTKEELSWLSGFLSKKTGAAAKVWTLKNSCEKQMVKRGMIPPIPQTNGDEERGKITLLLNHYNAAGMVDSVKGEKLAMSKFEHPAFVSAMRACHGVNDFFGDQAQEALEKKDIGFFRSTMEAVEAFAKGQQSPTKDSNKMVMHIRAGHSVAFRLIKEGKPEPTKQDFEKMVTRELKPLGVAPFQSNDKWREVLEKCDMGHLKQAFQGRRQTTSGKQR
ncbi:MAG: hypothetical protein AB8D78_01555 [Akkermansiaceae bacterium]